MRTYRFDPSTSFEGTAKQSDAGPEGVRREEPNNPAAPTILIALRFKRKQECEL